LTLYDKLQVIIFGRKFGSGEWKWFINCMLNQ
jgi:hypothetical protein